VRLNFLDRRRFSLANQANRPRNLETVIAFARFSEKTNADRASVLTTARYESWKNSFQSLGSTRYGLEELRPEWLPYPCSGTGVGRRLRARDWRGRNQARAFSSVPSTSMARAVIRARRDKRSDSSERSRRCDLRRIRMRGWMPVASDIFAVGKLQSTLYSLQRAIRRPEPNLRRLLILFDSEFA